MTVKADNSLKGGHLISLRPMNNATQTDVSGHSLVAQDMAREGREGGAAGQPIIPGHSGRTPDFEIFVFLSDLFLSLLMPSYAIMRWIWAALSSSTFSCNTSDVNWGGGQRSCCDGQCGYICCIRWSGGCVICVCTQTHVIFNWRGYLCSKNPKKSKVNSHNPATDITRFTRGYFSLLCSYEVADYVKKHLRPPFRLNFHIFEIPLWLMLINGASATEMQSFVSQFISIYDSLAVTVN